MLWTRCESAAQKRTWKLLPSPASASNCGVTGVPSPFTLLLGVCKGLNSLHWKLSTVDILVYSNAKVNRTSGDLLHGSSTVQESDTGNSFLKVLVMLEQQIM